MSANVLTTSSPSGVGSPISYIDVHTRVFGVMLFPSSSKPLDIVGPFYKAFGLVLIGVFLGRVFFGSEVSVLVPPL